MVHFAVTDTAVKAPISWHCCEESHGEALRVSHPGDAYAIRAVQDLQESRPFTTAERHKVGHISNTEERSRLVFSRVEVPRPDFIQNEWITQHIIPHASWMHMRCMPYGRIMELLFNCHDVGEMMVSKMKR